MQNISFGGYVIMLPYIMAIIMLPFEMPKMLVLFLSFVLGICIDVFYDSAGLHAAACTAMGFSRHYILKYIAPRGGYDIGVKPIVSDMGITWFLSYAATLVAVHHFVLFYLEVFRFTDFLQTLWRVIRSSIGTFALIYLIQFLFYGKRKN
ncbi:MAG: rod shape-determining protein MreD [Bacteroidetes bacterium]|nr:rod shape-determining protein MreD [Bacteroidota bacterium]